MTEILNCAPFWLFVMLAVAALLGWLLRHFMGDNNGSGTNVDAGVIPLSVDASDLKVVEGIGPKIEELLHNDGIKTWADLAAASTDRLQNILTEAGPRFKMHDPKTWAEQAAMARDGKWNELTEYQDFLVGGK